MALPSDPPALRILHLVAYPLFSGPMEPTTGLALAQERAGHRVWLAFDTKRGAFSPYEEAAAPRLEALGIAVPEGLVLSTKSSPLELLGDLRRLRRFVRESAIDVVHVHMSHDHVLAALGGLGGGPGRVLVRTIHADRSLAVRFGQRWLLSRADGWVVRCSSHRQRLLRLVGAHAPVEVIPGSIDAERWRPSDEGSRASARRRFGIPADARLIVHVALIDGRGQEELAGALVRVNSSEVHVLYVGRGRAEEALRLMTEGSGLTGKVHFAGYLQGDALLAAYAAADVAFVAQAGNDASVRAVLEAMASGLPVMGVQTDAIAEAVDSTVGYPVVDRSPRAIAEAIREWLADGNGAERGVAARNKVLTERRFEDEARATVAMYNRLLGVH